jgi:sulfatase modifying factor 1
MRHLFLVTAVIALLTLGRIAQAITIETVHIGDAGNTADTAVMMQDGTTGYGSVSYNYYIGKYEVTSGQYTAFLNSKANVSDAYGLYNSNMWSSSYGCKIQQTSISGGYSYSVTSYYANRPVNFVNYWDACRFANWLNNGQGNGDTETGAYTLNGYNGADGRTIGRNAGATWALTSEDEWYKAAYYKNGAYSLYANGTSVAPVAGIDSNYIFGATIWDGAIYGVLEQNGTKDMMGNVWEWNEGVSYNADRYVRGGAFYSNVSNLQPNHYGGPPYTEDGYAGFRVSQVVPEPSSILTLIFGIGGMGGIMLRRKSA